jgi:hypothetical protein
VDGKPNAVTTSIQLLQPNAQARIIIKNIKINKTQGKWLDALGLALIITLVGLPPLEISVLAQRDLAHMQKMATTKQRNAWGAK